MQKVKAHVSKAKQAQLSAAERTLIAGNDVVDILAKAGAGLGANFGKTKALQQHFEKLTWTFRHIADLSACRGEEGWQDADSGVDCV